jgi:hypothetical protein
MQRKHKLELRKLQPIHLSQVIYNKEPFNIYLFKSYQHNNYTTRMAYTIKSDTSVISHKQNL